MAHDRDPLTHGPVDNGPLTMEGSGADVWSLPSDEGLVGQHPAQLPALQFDYAAGIIVGHGEEANAQPAAYEHPHIVRNPYTFRRIFQQTSGQTDPTTGNLVIRLFLCPLGHELEVGSVVVDLPGSATITPSAPFANAASFAFLAVAAGGATAASVAQMRAGLVAFAPIVAAGPILPGHWTFDQGTEPIVHGGQELFYVLSGGSIAALLNQQVQATLHARELGLA
jgi:hypothetical protein